MRRFFSVGFWGVQNLKRDARIVGIAPPVALEFSDSIHQAHSGRV